MNTKYNRVSTLTRKTLSQEKRIVKAEAALVTTLGPKWPRVEKWSEYTPSEVLNEALTVESQSCLKRFEVNDHSASFLLPLGWGCRIHRLRRYREVRPPTTSVLDMSLKKSDGEVPVMLELWGMISTPSLTSLQGSLGPELLAPDKGTIHSGYLI